MDLAYIFKKQVEMMPPSWDHYNLLVGKDMYEKAKEAVNNGEKGFEQRGNDIFFLGQKIVKYEPPKF